MQIITRLHIVGSLQAIASEEVEQYRNLYEYAKRVVQTGVSEREIGLFIIQKTLSEAEAKLSEVNALCTLIDRKEVKPETVRLKELDEDPSLLRVGDIVFHVNRDTEGWFHTRGWIISVKP